jgi:1-acyl-sn-glycerol-3-phosphate acyltransferase
MLKYPRLLLRCGPKLLWTYLFYLNRYARHPERYPLAERYKKIRELVVFILSRFRIDWKIRGLDNLQALEKGEKKFLIVANHQSDLDPLILVSLCAEPISFVAKKETRKMPFIGTAVKALDGVFLDRRDLRQSLEVMKLVEGRLAQGYCNYAIFPDGTRNKSPEITPVEPFHAGSFKPAFLASSPILPLALYGTFRSFRPAPDPKRDPVELTFFTPIGPARYPSTNTTDLAAEVHDLVSREVESFKKEDAAFYANHNEKVPLSKGPLR